MHDTTNHTDIVYDKRSEVIVQTSETSATKQTYEMNL